MINYILIYKQKNIHQINISLFNKDIKMKQLEIEMWHLFFISLAGLS